MSYAAGKRSVLMTLNKVARKGRIIPNGPSVGPTFFSRGRRNTMRQVPFSSVDRIQTNGGPHTSAKDRIGG